MICRLVTGFNTETNKHDTIEEFDTYRTKKSIGAANMCVKTSFYRATSDLWSAAKSWDYKICQATKKPIIASKPSLVDHIGKKGKWAREDYYDDLYESGRLDEVGTDKLSDPDILRTESDNVYWAKLKTFIFGLRINL